MENWITENWPEILGVLLLGLAGYIRLDQRAKNIRLQAEEIKLQAEQDKVAAKLREEAQRTEFNNLIIKFSEESIRRNERLEGVVDRANKQIADLKTALQEQSDASEQQRQNHAREIQKQAGEFRQEIQDYQKIVLDKENKYEALRRDFDELNTKVEGQKELIDGMAKDIGELRGERDSLLKTIGEKDATIAALTERIEHLEKEIETKNREIAELKAEMENLRFQRQLEEPVKETAHEPAPAHPSAVESASAESAVVTPDDGTGGGVAA